MTPNQEGMLDFNPSRRNFMATTAGLGAAGLLTLGANSRADAANLGSQSEFTSAFRSIILHENEHVAFLCQALGKDARPKPTFKGLQQSSLQNFLTLARTFENTGAGAYLNASQFIHSPTYLEQAASIALVEGRHAGFLNIALGQPITVNNTSFETANSPGYVANAVAPFIQSLNGGPALTYGYFSTVPNDIAILNFALALEYLEAEFYNINVPIYY